MILQPTNREPGLTTSPITEPTPLAIAGGIRGFMLRLRRLRLGMEPQPMQT